MQESTTTRRTIAKGAAWAVPVIAVAAAVPAYAASGEPPPITQVTGLGCKEPGESFVVKGDSTFKFGYRFALVSTTAGVVSIQSATLPGNDDVGVDTTITRSISVGQTFFFTVFSRKSANGSGVLVLILNGTVFTIPVTTNGFPVCDR